MGKCNNRGKTFKFWIGPIRPFRKKDDETNNTHNSIVGSIKECSKEIGKQSDSDLEKDETIFDGLIFARRL